MSKKVLITAALPYSNGKLHIGHFAGVYLPGDVFARFSRFVGNDVLYVCGSDEFGFAISMHAEKNNVTPLEHSSFYHELNKSLFEKIGIKFDFYSRTTSKNHEAPVKQFFVDLLTAGLVEERESYQLFSESESRFLADRYIVGTCPSCGYDQARGDECPSCGASYESIDMINPKSVMTGSSLEKRLTNHWYLRLDLLKDSIERWLDTRDWKQSSINFLKKYCEDLNPRAITRDTNWGVPLPSDCGIDAEKIISKVLYVWFDAPIGYISATIDWAESIGNNDKWKDYWLSSDVKLVQFIGKDNLVFHGIVFPGMIMGQSQPFKLVDQLVASEFLKYEGKKISKSDGNYVDIDDLLSEFDLDHLRYFLIVNYPENSDSDFKISELKTKCNNDLVGKLGNFVNRVSTFVAKNMSGIVPERFGLNQDDELAIGKAKAFIEEIKESYDSCKFRRAVSLIMEICSIANNYFDKNQPWILVKDDSQRGRLDAVVFTCLEFAKFLSIVILPILPDAAQLIWEHVGGVGQLTDKDWDYRVSHTVIAGSSCCVPKTIFRKIDDASSNHKSKEDDKKQTSKTISINDFSKVEIVVGKVLSAEKIEKSDKLLCLKVDIGSKELQIVSGIAKKYEPASIIGKKVLVVKNLEIAKIMGIESQGMILCASKDENLTIVGHDDLVIGSIVC